MAQSLSSIYLHAVFSTEARQPFLLDPEVRRKAFAFIASASKELDCPTLEVNGHIEHVHVLARFSKTITVSEWLKEIKRTSSLFLKNDVPSFAWQPGYGVFGVEAANLDVRRRYIRMQEEHHASVSFQDELRALFRESGVEWDERYLWD